MLRSIIRKSSLGVLVIGLAGVMNCISPPLETPIPVIAQQASDLVAQQVKNKVDILFLIDNSKSMDPHDHRAA